MWTVNEVFFECLPLFGLLSFWWISTKMLKGHVSTKTSLTVHIEGIYHGDQIVDPTFFERVWNKPRFMEIRSYSLRKYLEISDPYKKLFYYYITTLWSGGCLSSQKRCPCQRDFLSCLYSYRTSTYMFCCTYLLTLLILRSGNYSLMVKNVEVVELNTWPCNWSASRFYL